MAFRKPRAPDHESPRAAEWIGASDAERAAALADLLDLADAFPQGRRSEGSPSLAEKVKAVDRTLADAGIPHALGGAVALAYYGEPRTTIDIDVNAFVAADRWRDAGAALSPLGIEVDGDVVEITREQDVRFLWDRNPVHIFFSHDELHAAMPAAVREVEFGRGTIPIVSAEHLVVRKAILDRPKDWPDIEAILTATKTLDLAEIESWLVRLGGLDDPRVKKMGDLIARSFTWVGPDRPK
jgi:hypothetical protein